MPTFERRLLSAEEADALNAIQASPSSILDPPPEINFFDVLDDLEQKKKKKKFFWYKKFFFGTKKLFGLNISFDFFFF